MRIIDEGHRHLVRVTCGHCGTVYELDPTVEGTAKHHVDTENVYHDANQRRVDHVARYDVYVYFANCPVCNYKSEVHRTRIPSK